MRVPRPIKTGLEFEAAFPVMGRILQAIMCECEAEGEIRIRVSRDPKKGWSYNPKDPKTYIDIHAYDPRDTYAKVRPGEWADGRVVCYGFLKRVRARRIEMLGSILASGTRLTRAVPRERPGAKQLRTLQTTPAFPGGPPGGQSPQDARPW